MARIRPDTELTVRGMQPAAQKLDIGLSVLVAEDDALLGIVLGDVLAGLGHTVCAIETTESGTVAAAARCRPDLMIVDAQLGSGSGVAAVEEIERAGPVPHLFVSGDVSGILARNPAAIVMQKPYRESDLLSAMQRAIGRGRPPT
jgi:CheY-like chemotaxis protein